MAQSTTDQRPSSTLNLFYSNKTVPASMMGKWTKYGTTISYLYGNPLQVLFTGLGYVDFVTKFGAFAFDVVVPLSAVAQLPLRVRTWQGVLTEWVGISVLDVTNTAYGVGDVLILVGVHDRSDARIISRAVDIAKAVQSRGGSILHILRHGQKVPKQLLGIQKAGMYFVTQNAFMEQVVDNWSQHRASENILIFGDESQAVIGTTMGAVDHWLRRPGIGKGRLSEFAPRVIVDSRSPVLTASVGGYADVLSQLQIPILNAGEQPLVQLDMSPDQLQLRPVQM